MMAKLRDRALAKAVSTYLLDTTELRPQPNMHAVWAIINGAVIIETQQRIKPDIKRFVMSTGSVSELYIEPMAPCFGDYDTMYHYSNMIAVPEDDLLPCRLPDEFHHDVDVYLVIDSHIPGYVYLLLTYQLRRCDDGTFCLTMNLEDLLYRDYLLHSVQPNDPRTHGPATVNLVSNLLHAVTGRLDEPDDYTMSVDWVFSVRCLVWPPQAAAWPGRSRPHGCPDPSIVDAVVADGCHMVPVAHRLCRDDEWMGNCQWRLSFSKAEIRLLNNWTPIQQIVYHVLRCVLKIVAITTEDQTTVVSNYHVKTMMMWAVEQYPAVWWNTGDSCIVDAAARLLDTLACRLAERYCQHYFVDNANLFLLTEDQVASVESVLMKLWSVADSDELATLLMDKYVRPCVLQVCPLDIVLLFLDNRNLDEAISAVVQWRRNFLREKSWRSIDSCSHSIERFIFEMSLTTHSCHFLLKQLHGEEQRLVEHFIGFTCLHSAYRMSAGSTDKDELLDVLSILLSWPSDTNIWTNGKPTLMMKATALLKALAHAPYKKPRSLERVVQVELCKAYLYSQLNDNIDYSVLCPARVYLAALYLEEGCHEKAMDYCRLVQTSSSQHQCEGAVQTELVPRIDGVYSVQGVVVLYEFLRTSVLSRQQPCEKSFGIMSSHLLAQSMLVDCLSQEVENNNRMSVQLKRYWRSLVECKQTHIVDILLFKLTAFNRRASSDLFPFKDEYSGSIPTWKSSVLVEQLTQLAVERMTRFREIQSEDFGDDIVPGTTDFRAMYAFRRGFYYDCMQLCQTNIENFADYEVLQEIFMIPEFVFLLGECDLVCVIGLALLVLPEARYDHTLMFVFRLSQLSLALYLYTECQLRLRHSKKLLKVTSHCANLAGRNHPPYALLNHFTIQLINRKITRRLRAAR